MSSLREICEETAKQIVLNYRKSIPEGMEFYNGGGGSPKLQPPPMAPNTGDAAKKLRGITKPKGFLSTIMTAGQPAVDNSKNIKTLLGG